MNRLSRCCLGGLGTLVVLISGGYASAKPPNVLLIISDDQAAAHVGCYGNDDVKTPNLDALAADGTKFTRFYTTCPQCAPSRSSFMTGRSPVSTNMTRFAAPLPREIVTFPELLRKAGYYTGICGRSYHLDGSGKMPPETAKVFQEYDLKTFADRVDWLPTGNSDANAMPGALREFLSQATDKPFFLQVGYSDPHRAFTAGTGTTPPQDLKLPPFFPDTPALRKDFSEYYAEIERVDGNIGKLLDALEESGRVEDTIVIFVGDNGCALLRGKGTLYEFGLNVPLIIRWPGVTKPGSVCDAVTSGEDLAPTILKAANLEVPNSMTGISFLPALEGEKFEGRDYAFAERGAHGSSLPNSTAAFDLGRTMIGRRYKLIYNALPKLSFTPVDFSGNGFWKEIVGEHERGELRPLFERLYFPPERPMFELYDLQTDPHELINLAGQAAHADTEHELKAAMQKRMILDRDYLPLPIPPGNPPARQTNRKPRVEPTPEPITGGARKGDN